MLKEIGAAAIKDFIGLLKQEKDFFSLDESARRKVFTSPLKDYPKTFEDYLCQVNEENFLKELKHALNVFDRSSYADPKNGFLNALAHYISESFGLHFDQLNIQFFFAPYTERVKVLDQAFSGQTALHQSLREVILRSTYQEIGLMANQALSYLKITPTIVIQSPLELESDLRVNIRRHITEKYPFSFPEFQVNPQIIGGMRIFVAGKLVDESWMGRIQALSHLTELSK